VKTLNHIKIYNPVFNLVNNCCICSPCCMMSSVEMAALHLNMNYICNKLFIYCLLNLINTQNHQIRPYTPWMKQNYKKIINIDYYCFLPSMNHFRLMKIQYICQLFCSICFIRLLIPIFYIPCFLQLSCIYTKGGSNHLL